MRRAIVAVVVVASGCAPRLSELVEKHHYREAVCAAYEGGAEERAFVTQAIARDGRAHLHVETVHGMHLERVLGPDDPMIGVARFARVKLQLDAIPVDDVSASISLRDAKGDVAAVPLSRRALVALTGEALPSPVTFSTYRHMGTFWRVVGVLFSLGMSLPFTEFRERTFSVAAPDVHFQASAPRAHALLHAMRSGCTIVPSRRGTTSKGLSCEWFVSIIAAREQMMHLDVTLSYSANRVRGDPACEVAWTSSITLGRADELALSLSRRFGGRMRPLAP